MEGVFEIALLSRRFGSRAPEIGRQRLSIFPCSCIFISVFERLVVRCLPSRYSVLAKTHKTFKSLGFGIVLVLRLVAKLTES